jgi:hypothetical protein
LGAEKGLKDVLCRYKQKTGDRCACSNDLGSFRVKIEYQPQTYL